jgi:hypothetical protein
VSLGVGDRIIETTPTGRVRHLVVRHVDVEPKYRHGYDGRFVEIHGDGQRFVMREADVLSADWMAVGMRMVDGNAADFPGFSFERPPCELCARDEPCACAKDALGRSVCECSCGRCMAPYPWELN